MRRREEKIFWRAAARRRSAKIRGRIFNARRRRGAEKKERVFGDGDFVARGRSYDRTLRRYWRTATRRRGTSALKAKLLVYKFDFVLGYDLLDIHATSGTGGVGKSSEAASAANMMTA